MPMPVDRRRQLLGGRLDEVITGLGWVAGVGVMASGPRSNG